MMTLVQPQSNMAIGEQSLDELARGLESSRERQRLHALAEIEKRGAAARPLAERVVALFEDESAAVQLQAVHAFRGIAPGATEIVPRLLAILGKGEPPLLVARATFCLGWIGPSASAALPALKARLRESPLDKEVLEALLAIAPRDVDVLDAVVTSAFSSSYTLGQLAADAIAAADETLVERVYAEMEVRARADGGARRATACLLITVGPRRPARADALLRELLREPSAPETWPAVSAVGNLPAPRPRELIDAVIRVAASDVEAKEQALKVLAGLGSDAAPAHATFVETLWQNVAAPPLCGEAGAPSRAFAYAAKGLAEACPTPEAVDPLLVWLRRVSAAAQVGTLTPSWYTIGEVIEVLAELAPGAASVREAIAAAEAAAHRRAGDDESGVLDFERTVRRALERFHR